MSPYYGPTNESTATIMDERTFVAGDFICGTGYGIQCALFAVCVKHLWRERHIRRNVFLLVYITILWIVETIFGAVQANTVQVMYIDNRNYPGGPWAYFLATQQLAINVIFYATLFILTFLADVLVLWRCWVIWNAISGRRMAFLITALPGLVLAGSFAVGTMWTLESSQPGLSMYSKSPQAFGTAFYAISLGVNIVLTALISARLMLYRRQVSKVLSKEHTEHYVSVMAIMIESAALYSVSSIPFLITYAMGNYLLQIFLAVTSAVQQIAAYLIIYRLAENRGWRKDTTIPGTMTQPQFSIPALTESQFADSTTVGRHSSAPGSRPRTGQTVGGGGGEARSPRSGRFGFGAQELSEKKIEFEPSIPLDNLRLARGDVDLESQVAFRSYDD